MVSIPEAKQEIDLRSEILEQSVTRERQNAECVDQADKYTLFILAFLVSVDIMNSIGSPDYPHDDMSGNIKGFPNRVGLVKIGPNKHDEYMLL